MELTPVTPFALTFSAVVTAQTSDGATSFAAVKRDYYDFAALKTGFTTFALLKVRYP